MSTSAQIADSDGFEEGRKRNIEEARSRIKWTWFLQITALVVFPILAYWTSGIWKNHAMWAGALFFFEGIALIICSIVLFYIRDMARDDLEDALDGC